MGELRNLLAKHPRVPDTAIQFVEGGGLETINDLIYRFRDVEHVKKHCADLVPIWCELK